MNYRILVSKLLIFSFTCAYTMPIFYYSESIPFFLQIYLWSLVLLLLLFLTNFNFNSNNITISNNKLLSKFQKYIILITILFIYLLIYFKSREYFVGYFNRTTRESEFIQSNFYVILDIILKCLIAYLFHYEKKSTILKICLLILALLFDFAYLGGRRTSSFIFLLFLWSVIKDINKLKFYLLLCSLFIMSIFSFLFSGYRELLILGFDNLSMNDVLNASLLTNEFQLVSSYFVDYVKFSDEIGFSPFAFIFSTVSIFIPRFIWINKPLTIDKALGTFPNIFGELYYSFGPLSILIFLIIIFCLLKYLYKESIYSIILFALIPDLFRTTFNQYLLTIILFVFFLTFIKIIIPAKNNL
jgi:oligosaccharide repeat unit polymerase